MTVTVRAQAAGTLRAVQVLTWGVENADFAAAPSGSTCLAGSQYSVGQTCTVGVVFTPAFPGVRAGAVVLLSDRGSVLATQYLSGIGEGPLGVLVPGVIRTVAGNGQWTAVGDGLPATSAELFLPASVAIDGAGNLYIADSVHNRIRKVAAATGIVATIAGDGGPGYAGDRGPAVAAELNTPSGVALDGAGNIYIADTGNNVVRKIDAATGTIATVAGNGAQRFGGDNGAATSASLNSPAGVTVDLAGDIVIADTSNHRVRLVDASSGTIATIAGNGATTATGAGSYSGDGGPAPLAGLNYPHAVGYDQSGNMYIPDAGNNRIRMVSASTGKIETVAGGAGQGFAGDNGPAILARLYSPSGVAFDAAGNLFIADTQNNRIRKVNAITGIIATVAGSGTGRFGGDGASAESAQLYGPYSVFADASGDLFIADYFDNRVREISSAAALLSFTPATEVGSVSAPQIQLVENDGNAALDFGSIVASANVAVDPAATTCSVGAGLDPDTTCAVGVEFAPTEAGNPATGDVVLAETPGSAALSIGATGQALALNSTATLVASSANPSIFGQAVQFLATVTSNAGTPAGVVTFTDRGIVVGAPVALNASGSAVYSLSSPAVGLHSIVASYGGDANHLPSASASLAQAVEETTSTAVASSRNPIPANASVTFTATVESGGGGVAPTGEVVFQDGATTLGSAAIDSFGRASLTVAALAAGSHSITASYSGLPSAQILGSISTPLNQAVQGPTATLLSPSANPSLFGQTVQLLATVTGASGTPTGTVTFAADGNVLGAPVQLSALGTAVYALLSSAVGPHSIVAAYSGDATHLAGVSNVVGQTVDEATTTAIASSQNPSAPSASVTFTATVSGVGGGVAPTGTVAFQDGPVSLGASNLNPQGKASLTVAGLAAGPHSITASYSGVSAAYILGSLSAALSQTVQAQTATLLSSSANPSIYGGSVVLSANVSANGPAAATGTVNFFDGRQQIGSAALAPSTGNAALSTASFYTSALTAGLHAITAVYGGSQADVGSVSPALAQTVQATPTAVNAGSSLNPSIVLSPITLTASVAGSHGPAVGAVVFLADATPLATQTLDATGFASISTSALAVGQHTLSVNYLGDQNDFPSSSNPFAQTVQVIPTVTSLSGAVASGANPQLTLSATVAGASGPVPTGSVVFESGSTVLGTGIVNSSGVAVLTLAADAAAASIVAAYPGDPLHGPSQSSPLVPSAFAGGFQLVVNPESVTVPTSQNVQVSVTIHPGTGFTDQIGLGCASLPALVTCYFSSDSVALKPNGAVTEELTIDTDSPLSGGPVAAFARPGPSALRTAGSLLPAALILLTLAGRRRDAKLRRRWLALLAMAAAPQIIGCGAITQKSAAPGTYVLQVVATGLASGITQTVNVTVDVTK